jgi:chemotaxis protein CheX
MSDIVSPQSITLAENLDLKAASALQNELLAQRHGPVLIDGSQVQRLSGLCLQVLLSAKATWAGDGESLSFNNLSPALRDALQLFGAEDLPSTEFIG